MHACLGTAPGTCCGGWLFSEVGLLSTCCLSCIALANCSSLTFGDGLSPVPGAAARHKKMLMELSQDLPRDHGGTRNHGGTQLDEISSKRRGDLQHRIFKEIELDHTHQLCSANHWSLLQVCHWCKMFPRCSSLAPVSTDSATRSFRT